MQLSIQVIAKQYSKGNSEYHYLEHDLYGKPENISQAAYACLYDYLMDSPDTVTWEQMEIVLNEE